MGLASGKFRETRLPIAMLPQAIAKVEKLKQTVNVNDFSDGELAAIIRRGEAAQDAQLGRSATIVTRIGKR